MVKIFEGCLPVLPPDAKVIGLGIDTTPAFGSRGGRTFMVCSATRPSLTKQEAGSLLFRWQRFIARGATLCLVTGDDVAAVAAELAKWVGEADQTEADDQTEAEA